MSDSLIIVENLGKKYRIKHQAERQRYVALRDVLADKTKGVARRLWSIVRRPWSNGQLVSLSNGPSTEDFWALKDVSFEVKQGEVVGIIGRNGAGKSTLLKILSRITEPTTGKVHLKGRVASLLEVGTGFHPELTGRENIFLNGAILGMTRAEIKNKFDEIVAFSEVEKFLDTPVKRYSSGMYVRLAFSVAAHLEPEILVVDEVLAVGDAEFQRKCLGKMEQVSKGGRTVLFVSHNMTAVMNLCSHGVLLESGRLASQGTTERVVSRYLGDAEKSRRFQPRPEQRLGDRQVSIQNFEVRPDCVKTGAAAEFVFSLHRADSSSRKLSAEVAISVLTEFGAKLLHLHSHDMGVRFEIPTGCSQIVAKVDRLVLAPGNYWLNLWIGSGENPYDWARESFFLPVEPGSFADGSFVQHRGYPLILPAEWRQHAEVFAPA